ncbi:FkbM family methyltransferase [Enterobacter pseudoroggenkampii]|uniref:FkbM family methyltransferase n=1 Tax=Enterobacter pseudoroggenkampii TaxID=2996112 RepID=UPI0025B1876F|nr:FkbM family methyltransferase [Enterobacter pseudoroggenkampii]WJW96593.1 FkbM family methyltransferase [Enterobacter pseudoroggenkampii]
MSELSLEAILSPEQSTRIVDIGANPCDGVPPYQILMEKGLAEVTGFEPQPEAYAALQKARTLGVTFLPCAIGDGREHTLYLYNYSGLASLFKANPAMFGLNTHYRSHQSWKVLQQIPVRTKRLDDTNEIERIDLLKMDVQGSELSILQNGIRKLKETLIIQLEVSFLPLYLNQPAFGEVDMELRRQGFLPHCISAQKNIYLHPVSHCSDRPANQVLEMDMVYIRDFTDMSAFTVEQLKQVAIIMHYCYGSVDMVIRCIMALEDSTGCNYLQDYLALLEGYPHGSKQR